MSLFAAEDLPVQTAQDAAQKGAYRVLARKYRPQNFSQLIGQEALVRTLTNAIQMGRLAHAWMLTGIRGIGKTTTARIIAKALNCENGPTATPCDACSACVSIREGRNIDVIEIDAASNTGVDNIRELIDSARYAPTTARYKVYIIDEVHMLSKSAFNALLKTLEEPPAHVKFVLATTEVRKIPVTVLSRCQRFDLRRIEVPELEKYFTDVLTLEGGTVEPEAMRLIAIAADGSARDGMSLLDQALSTDNHITFSAVQNMLGLADRAAIYGLAESLFAGRGDAALTAMHDLYRAGADPVLVLQDLLSILHMLARLMVTPTADLDLAGAQRDMAMSLATKLTMPQVQRAWQILLRGVAEVAAAPQPQVAAEMVLLRLAYAAELPPPGELLRALGQGDGGAAARQSQPSAPPPPGGGSQMRVVSNQTVMMAPAPAVAAPAARHSAMPKTFAEVAALFEQNREAIMHSVIYSQIRPVNFAPGRMEIALVGKVATDFTGKVAQKLQQWTGQPWLISVVAEAATPTLAEQAAADADARLHRAAADPMVRAVLEHFPGARIVKVLAPETDNATGDNE